MEDLKIPKERIQIVENEKVTIELGSSTPQKTIRFVSNPLDSDDNTLTMLRLIKVLSEQIDQFEDSALIIFEFSKSMTHSRIETY